MRKISLLLCLIVLCFSVTACGSTENLSSDSSSTVSESPITGPEKLVLIVDDLQASYDVNQTIETAVEIIPSLDKPVPLIYQSSDPTVATFSDGVIFTLQNGKTSLTVATENGEIISNSITIHVEDLKEKENQAQAQEAIEAINQIQQVTLSSGDLIQKARAMYDQLSDGAKAHVTNLDVLDAAEKQFAALSEEQARKAAEAATEPVVEPPVEEPVYEESPEAAPPVEEKLDQDISGTVYWTPKGKSYHSTSGCRSLARSKIIHSGSVADANAAGKYDPCNNCIR